MTRAVTVLQPLTPVSGHTPGLLVPRPRHSASPFVAEYPPRLGGGKSPVDLSSRSVGARSPGARAFAQGIEMIDTIATMTFTRPETRLDLRRIQPAAMLGGVVRREAGPQRGPTRGPQDADHRRLAVQIQVIHDEMNRRGRPIASCDPLQRADEAGGLPVRLSRGSDGDPPSVQRCNRYWPCHGAHTRSPRERCAQGPSDDRDGSRRSTTGRSSTATTGSRGW